MFWPDRSSRPVMAARWAAVTSAQPLALGTRAISASRTASVRPQMPAAAAVSLSFTVTVTSSIVMSL